MRRSYLLKLITLAAVLLFTAAIASAQTDQMRGTGKMVGADGQQHRWPEPRLMFTART